MIWRIIIIIILIMCFAGAQLRETDYPEDEFINFTDKIGYDELNLTFYQRGMDTNNSFVVRTLYKTVDLMGFVWVEGMKVSMMYGYYNPQYNFELAWKLMFITMFAILIMPLIYVVLFIGYGISQLIKIIKRWRADYVKKNPRNNN